MRLVCSGSSRSCSATANAVDNNLATRWSANGDGQWLQLDLGTGQTSIADGTNYIQAIVAEAIGTFLLVTAIMALAVDRRAPGGWAGLMIGLAVAAGGVRF